MLAGAESHVDEVIRDGDHVGVVFDDDHGVALIAELPKDRDQPLVVARVQADRRLVEHVERADQRRTERRREVDALRLAARQRRRQPIERQVVEADVAQEAEPALNLVQHLVGDRRFLLGELQLLEELLGFAHGARRRLVDRHAADMHIARFAPQARAAAIRARQVAAIAAEEHADVDLVFLALEPAEEPAHALEVVAVAVHHERDFFRRQVAPRHVEAEALGLGGALQLGEMRAVVRLGPRLDRALVDRLLLIGHHQVLIELDDVAEAVAGRAGAERVVEREQARLRILVGNAAGPALEALGEQVLNGPPALSLSKGRRQLQRPRRAAAFGVRGLDRIGDARARVRRRP